MKKSKARTKKNSKTSRSRKRRQPKSPGLPLGRELFYLAVSALLLMTLFALATYNPQDHLGQGKINNSLGSFGDELAQPLVKHFGIGAFAVPLLPIILFLTLIIGRKVEHLPAKFLSLGLMLGAFMPLVTITNCERAKNYQAGGVIGARFADYLIERFNQPGALVILGLVLIVSFMIYTRIPFSLLVGMLGRMIIYPLRALSSGADGFGASARDFFDDLISCFTLDEVDENEDEDEEDEPTKQPTSRQKAVKLKIATPVVAAGLKEKGAAKIKEPSSAGAGPENTPPPEPPRIRAERPVVPATPAPAAEQPSSVEPAIPPMPAWTDNISDSEDDLPPNGPEAPDQTDWVEDDAAPAKKGRKSKKGADDPFDFKINPLKKFAKREEKLKEDKPGHRAPATLEEGQYFLPPYHLLDYDEKNKTKIDKDHIYQNAEVLVAKLADFGIKGTIKEVQPGPVITMYEYEPAPGIKINKIANLADDLAMALKAIGVRIIAPIPGKAVVGIEIPNKGRETVYLKEIICDEKFQSAKSRLSLAMGKQISGESMIADLAQMPHLLIAGATGTGKSVFMNCVILSLLFKALPNEVRLIMVDPKMLELSVYNDIPHLLHQVVTDPKKAANVLNWAVREMEERYKKLSAKGVRNIDGYNQRMEEEILEWERQQLQAAKEQANKIPEEVDDEANDEPFEPPPPPEKPSKIPYIIIMIDELADLMMVASKDIEESICRLAQMARAAGIHLIMATQRPSVDVITGVIKANFPSRVAFKVSSKIDSRTILDANGAELLLGMGDLLFIPPRSSLITRVHGAYVSEKEIERVVEFLKRQGRPVYDESIVHEKEEDADLTEEEQDLLDEKYDAAVQIVAETRQASISMIQRRLRIGYNRAARMVELMEKQGLVGPADGAKPRDVFVNRI
jgi:S-DNA-T family DNA segregation ATPase FtsK/SpoIIIE